jgi:hypothetical protein
MTQLLQFKINWESELIVNLDNMKQVEQAGTLVEHLTLSS